MKTQTLAQAISEGFAKPEETEIKEGALVAETLLSEEEDIEEGANCDYLKEMGDMDDETKEKLEEEMKDMTEEEKLSHVKKVKEGLLEIEKNM